MGPATVHAYRLMHKEIRASETLRERQNWVRACPDRHYRFGLELTWLLCGLDMNVGRWSFTVIKLTSASEIY